MTIYIDAAYISRGKYYANGQEMPYCSRSGSKADIVSDTSHGYAAALGSKACYVTESVLDTFQKCNEWESIKPLILGVVPDKYAKKYNRGGTFKYCWELIEGIVPYPVPGDDPCADVSCPDMCVGADMYDQTCDNGVCVQGALVEYNSVHCGYIDPTPDPEPEPEPEPDPSKQPADMTICALVAIAIAYLILRR